MSVLRPRGIVALHGLAVATAAICVALAAVWSGLGLLWAGLLAAAVIVAALVVNRRAPSPVLALRTGSGGQGWQVLLSRGWLDAELLSHQRGAAWITLTMRAAGAQEATAQADDITFTVWQHTLLSVHWRRLCVLVGAVQHATPTVTAGEAS